MVSKEGLVVSNSAPSAIVILIAFPKDAFFMVVPSLIDPKRLHFPLIFVKRGAKIAVK